LLASQLQTTDSLGRVTFPSGAAPQGTAVIVRLEFAGDATYAPAETVFAINSPDPNPIVLTVTTIGNGRVTGDGIDCGSVCTAHHPIDAMVTLMATPNVGWVFSSWAGACTGSNACTVMMDQAKNVTATFTLGPQPGRHSLTVRLVNTPGCVNYSNG